MGELMQRQLAAGLKPGLTSCHTGFVGGYVVEGHVPAREVRRLLAERPEAVGLTVPDMPLGSPGKTEPYDVLEFIGTAAHRFTRVIPPQVSKHVCFWH